MPFSDRVRHLGPNWYAAVMGTAIVATAAAPHPALRPAGAAVWMLSCALLTALVAARAVHVARHRDVAREHLRTPATAVFYGCPPMALLATGHATLTIGTDVIGPRAAVLVDAALWTAGTVYAVAVAAAVPYLLVTRRADREADPTWLLPVVAPMVAATAGAALVPHLPPGEPRATLLAACAALFGASLLGTALLLPGIWTRIARSGLPDALTPSLFLVLGPLGQSVTAAGLLADAARTVLPQYAGPLRLAAAGYGVPVLGFALLWLAVAGAANLRALRTGLPFGLTWWAYTFPVGTCVTGAAVLARHTGLTALAAVSAALYALLAVAWTVVASRTAREIARGALLGRPARPADGNGTVAIGSAAGTMPP
ncbi:TDT family transporter [Actinomadura flavalba]|uniref:TDT family transporter n=1 Tax=Actinomadura flavalba TaxID=1120938 RepID=UPI00036D579A|nr:TDT family transporter [Actinomadura flavalba]